MEIEADPRIFRQEKIPSFLYAVIVRNKNPGTDPGTKAREKIREQKPG